MQICIPLPWYLNSTQKLPTKCTNFRCFHVRPLIFIVKVVLRYGVWFFKLLLLGNFLWNKFVMQLLSQRLQDPGVWDELRSWPPEHDFYVNSIWYTYYMFIFMYLHQRDRIFQPTSFILVHNLVLRRSSKWEISLSFLSIFHKITLTTFKCICLVWRVKLEWRTLVKLNICMKMNQIESFIWNVYISFGFRAITPQSTVKSSNF